MLSIILIPLSSYDSLTLASNENLSGVQSTIKTKLTGCSTRVSSVPAALPLSFKYFLLGCSSAISLPPREGSLSRARWLLLTCWFRDPVKAATRRYPESRGGGGVSLDSPRVKN